MAVNWQIVKEFIEKEVEKGPQGNGNHEILLYNSLTILYQLLLAYLNWSVHFEPAQARGLNQCVWCGAEFTPSDACSEKCKKLWTLYPPDLDSGTSKEKAQP